MARARRRGDSRKRTAVVDVALAAGTALGTVQTGRERLNALLLPLAWWVGCLGMMSLASCGVLAAIPEDGWPEALDPDLLPVYAMASLAAASLLGWGCMQRGLGVVRERIGWRFGGWLFVLLPLACVGYVLASGRLFEPDEWAYAEQASLFARWYPAGLVGLFLSAFVAGELRGGEGGVQAGLQRGAWSILLVGPYVLLMATLALGVDAPFLTETLRDTLEELGAGAIVAQVAIGYFIAAGASS